MAHEVIGQGLEQTGVGWRIRFAEVIDGLDDASAHQRNWCATINLRLMLDGIHQMEGTMAVAGRIA